MFASVAKKAAQSRRIKKEVVLFFTFASPPGGRSGFDILDRSGDDRDRVTIKGK